MALSVTSWPQATAFRVVYENAVTTTVQKNVTGASGTIRTIVLDNTQGAAACYLRIVDGFTATSGTTEPDWLFRAATGKTEVITIGDGGEFSEALTFWATRNVAYNDNTQPNVVTDGTVKVTIVVEDSTSESSALGPGY